MHPQPLICVRDVEANSRWYQRRLGCQRGDGGPQYERLVSRDRLKLQLDRWGVEHHHSPFGDAILPPGNGHGNPTDRNGSPNYWEIWLRDPDGYTVP